MNKDERMKILADSMEIDIEDLKDEMLLSSYDEWDSLAALSFMSLLFSKANKRITPNELKNLKTVADAINIME